MKRSAVLSKSFSESNETDIFGFRALRWFLKKISSIVFNCFFAKRGLIGMLEASDYEFNNEMMLFSGAVKDGTCENECS